MVKIILVSSRILILCTVAAVGTSAGTSQERFDECLNSDQQIHCEEISKIFDLVIVIDELSDASTKLPKDNIYWKFFAKFFNESNCWKKTSSEKVNNQVRRAVLAPDTHGPPFYTIRQHLSYNDNDLSDLSHEALQPPYGQSSMESRPDYLQSMLRDGVNEVLESDNRPETEKIVLILTDEKKRTSSLKYGTKFTDPVNRLANANYTVYVIVLLQPFSPSDSQPRIVWTNFRNASDNRLLAYCICKLHDERRTTTGTSSATTLGASGSSTSTTTSSQSTNPSVFSKVQSSRSTVTSMPSRSPKEQTTTRNGTGKAKDGKLEQQKSMKEIFSSGEFVIGFIVGVTACTVVALVVLVVVVVIFITTNKKLNMNKMKKVSKNITVKSPCSSVASKSIVHRSWSTDSKEKSLSN